MDNNVKNFYEEEAQYKKSIDETKELVEQIIKVDVENLSKKITSDFENDNFEASLYDYELMRLSGYIK